MVVGKKWPTTYAQRMWQSHLRWALLFYHKFLFMTVNKNEAGTLLPQAFTFNASNQQIRTIILDGEPYFVVKDVCDVLGHTNPSVAIQMIDEDERTKKSLGSQGESRFVNESGI